MAAVTLLIVGAVGGALNALLSGDAGFLPSLTALSPGSGRVLRVGVVGNAVLGCGAAAGPLWVIYASGFALAATTWPSFLLLGCTGCFIGFASSRWMTNEADKLVLRKAVFKAATAPAAHPDTVDEMRVARPYQLYVLTEGLQPRRSGYRRHGCEVNSSSGVAPSVPHAADEVTAGERT